MELTENANAATPEKTQPMYFGGSQFEVRSALTQKQMNPSQTQHQEKEVSA